MEKIRRTEINPCVFSKENIINRGTQSVCYREGDNVYKVMSGFDQQNVAIEAAEALINSRDILSSWLGEYVTPSKIEALGGVNGYMVVTEQPFIDGMSLKKAIEVAQKDNLSIDRIIDLFEKSLEMYRGINQVPDIFGRPHFSGWYQVLTTPNVRVELIDGVLIPRLLDVGFARLSQNKITKSLHNSLLAKNIGVLLEKTRIRST